MYRRSYSTPVIVHVKDITEIDDVPCGCSNISYEGACAHKEESSRTPYNYVHDDVSTRDACKWYETYKINPAGVI